MGSFALIAVTGILMFFHLDSGLNKLAHEWLGWGLVAAVGLHAAANLGMFKRYFHQRAALAVMGACLLLLAASFVSPPGDKAKPSHILAVQALLDAPVTVAAQVAGTDAEDAVARLRAAGFNARAELSLRQMAGAGRDEQMKALGVLFKK
ncbi:hypothetical protein A6A04_12850 [Paramagnetospirillum marisnigri]|uniref:Flavinylation-associated cytochrome domain-containing protein n=2 Tax=Paramagnetospirillum marisnigri TaxID=1285242 RepID=A0A178MV07_9PROT|nr:hypothetical protein A6A04_12850 [Paramagnetospirillum marisnigri]